MVAKQKQNGVTNTFQLDATGRQRQREQAGGVTGIEIFHYDGPGDSPAWTSVGATWSRDIPGIGGELATVQESSGTTTFKLTDLHGDAVASAQARARRRRNCSPRRGSPNSVNRCRGAQGGTEGSAGGREERNLPPALSRWAHEATFRHSVGF
jgi:hypothetical protein